MRNVGAPNMTYADLEAVPPHLVAEIIDGRPITRPVGAPHEAMVRTALSAIVGSVARSADMLVLSQIEIHIGEDVLVPHLGRWKRSVLAQHCDAKWLDVPPDWILEVCSFQDQSALQAKRRIYAKAGIGNLWCIDVSQRVLETFKLQNNEWQLTHRFGPGDVVSVDPFADIRFELNDLWPQLGGPSVTTTH